MKKFIAILFAIFLCQHLSAQETISWRKSTPTKSSATWYNNIIRKYQSRSKNSKRKMSSNKTAKTTTENSARNEASEKLISGVTKKRTFTGPEIFKRYNNAVFMILTKADKNIYQGSGFFISSSGLAVSNAHVFDNAEAVLVKKPGYDNYYAIDKIYYYDKEADFILFHVNIASNVFIPIAEISPSVGDKVYAIGSPKGLENTFASGEVSQKRGNHLLQISIPIDHGSSGGALLNEQGEVVGITVGGYESYGNLNFAIDINVIKKLLTY